MKLEELKTVKQLSHFLDGTQTVIFQISTNKKERYGWIRHELVRFNYLQLRKTDKGVVICYLMKASGYSSRRHKPQPNGQPGYIRIDTVHQGDQDKKKGVYHINAVDEVTQFEVVATVEKISEQYLIPVLEQILDTFPFKNISFHSDNGSEYINKNVARLLKKLFIEFTKSRSRHSNDNALAKSKNASIVRKVPGYRYIAQKWAELINEFDHNFLNPHINYHRPCFFPEIITDEKGKQSKKYPYKAMMTPYEKLKSLPESEKYLKNGVTF